MSNIFLSYSRKDKAIAQQIVDILNNLGHQLWWDEHLVPGQTFRTAIRQKIDEVDYVLVLWSKHSINSEWVQEEASLAHERKMLVPALLEDVEPPMPFGSLQMADLRKWKGDAGNQEFKRLLDALKQSLITNLPEEQQNTSISNFSEKNNKYTSSSAWKKWLTKRRKLSISVVLSFLFLVFLLINKLPEEFLNFERIWSRFNEAPELELSYSPKGRVYTNSRINLRYKAPPRGYISLWNQESPNSRVVRLIPDPSNEGHATQPLSEVFYKETLQIRPTYSNGIERYILLWTPEVQPEHLPKNSYKNQAEFDKELSSLRNKKNKVFSKILEIPVFIAR